MPGFPWDKNRIQDLPDPGGSKGGSDDQLGVSSDAIAEAEAEQNPYVPPYPVPLARMIERKPGARGISEPAWLLNPPAALPGFGVVVGNAGQFADDSTDAAINAVRVDNLTRQWMYFPDVQVWVPPLWIGRVFRYNGSHNRRVRFETPAGMTALTLSTTEVAAVTFYEEMMPEVDGEQLSSSVISGILGAVAIAGDAGQAQTQAYSADSLSQTLLGLITNARLQAWNQTTSAVDRLRTVLGDASTRTGVLPIVPMLWNGSTLDLGRSAVSDALAIAGVLGASVLGFTGGATPFDRLRLAKVFKPFGVLAIAASSTQTVWTPATGLKPRLMGFLVNLASTSAGPGLVTFFDNTTTGAVLAGTGWMSVPSSVTSGQVHSIRLDNGPIVSASSSVIVAWSSNAISIAGMVFGTEE